MKKAFFYCVLIALPFALLEGFFRLLPVSNPPYLLPVSAEQPVVRYEANVGYLCSVGWNFAVRARLRTNNFGYNHRWDYHPDDATPLLVVIGDSFVESMTVDSGKSAAELLHAGVEGKGRVYSIGVSGASLSQYLAFADFASTTFRPRAMAFVIVHNDFDESLLKYKSEPRFHYFDESADGLVLRRVDYERSSLRTLLRKSAFVRYVIVNVAPARIRYNFGRVACGSEDPYACEAQAALEQRVADSKRAIDSFLDQVPVKSGLGTDAIVFVLDALRPAMYSAAALREAEGSYAARMRHHFIEQARSRGFTVIDMQPAFITRHRQDNSRFEFPADAHWNELGQQLVAEEIRKSELFARILSTPGSH